MNSDRLANRACVTPANDTSVHDVVRRSRSAATRFRRRLNPTRLSVERLCERVLLSGVPYASEPALVQQVSRPDDCTLGGDFVFGSEAIARCFNGTIANESNSVIKDFQVAGTGRLVVEMLAAESALDSMLWLYDENGQTLLVNNDDGAAGSNTSRISQRLTEGKYRVKMTASLAATPAGQQGAFSLRLDWQPTAEISVATSQIEGGKEGAAIADLNGDGHLDIAAVNDDNLLTVANGIGDGSFREEVPIATLQGGASRRIIAGNFDGVGGLDLAIVLVQEKQLLLVSNDADGKWNVSGIAAPIDLEGTPDAMDKADLNNDQLDDLLVPTHDKNHWVFYGHAQTPFVARTKHQLLDDNGNVVEDGRGAIVGDFDGQNGPDIAIAVKEAGKV